MGKKEGGQAAGKQMIKQKELTLGVIQIVTIGLINIIMIACASEKVFNFPEYRILLVAVLILTIINLYSFLTKEGAI